MLVREIKNPIEEEYVSSVWVLAVSQNIPLMYGLAQQFDFWDLVSAAIYVFQYIVKWSNFQTFAW